MNKPSWTYISITFIITWSITLLSYMAYTKGCMSFQQLNMVYNLGALGPFLGAVISAKMSYGNEGVRTLFSRLRFRAASGKSIWISILPLAFFLAGLLFYPLMAGHWYTFADTKRQFNLTDASSYIYWILPFITYSIFEEFGWRGFLLPHLQARHTALRSTLILTLFWASWHLPFFLWRFQFSPLITIGFFFSIFVGAIIITSIFNFAKGSILPVMLFHFCNNLSSALDKETIVMVSSTCFVALAIWLVKKYKPENLCDGERAVQTYRKTPY